MPVASALPASEPAYVIALYVCTHTPPEHTPVAQSALLEHPEPTATRHAPVALQVLDGHAPTVQQKPEPQRPDEHKELLGHVDPAGQRPVALLHDDGQSEGQEDGHAVVERAPDPV